MTTRSEVVVCARSWIDTPFHHQACIKGVGVDCIHLLIGVSRERLLVPPDFDVPAYSRVPDGHTLLSGAELHMHRLEDGATMHPGQAVMVAFGGDPQHVGILGDYRHGGLSIIHAAANARPGRVIETRLMFSRAMVFVAAFELPGVTE